MSIKVDPRTGVIVQGHSRPSKFPITPHSLRLKKTNNMFPARPLPIGEVEQQHYFQASPTITREQLAEIAREIGNILASRIQSIPTQGAFATPVNPPLPKVHLNESIVDVGLGEQKPLEKGTGSAKIAKEAMVEDNITDLKKSLKAIKSS